MIRSKLRSKLIIEQCELLQPSKLTKMKKAELTLLCKKYKIKCSGKKDDLIYRLIKYSKGEDPDDNKTAKSSSSSKNKKSKASILQKISSQIPSIELRKNKYGNYEHFDTHFVFCKINKIVIGKQSDDGSISQLTPVDINICNKYKFKYTLPENLAEDDEDEDDNTLLEEEELCDDDFEDEIELSEDDE